MKVSTIGLGYIGLPTAALIASKGITVIGVDINKKTVETISKGGVHIKEKGLGELVKRVVAQGFLTAELTPQEADYFLIAVPTPFQENHQPDLSFVKAAIESVAPVLKKGDTLILESTSPVGTTEQMEKLINKLRPDLRTKGKDVDLFLAYCPERVLPGKTLEELVTNDRVVGGVNPESTEKACQLYKLFVEGQLLRTNAKTAEMAKLTENSFRDVNIAFANELSVLCDSLGISVWELIELCNHHPRVSILNPGPGVGGHCIAVDPWFIVAKNPNESKLIKTARLVNDSKPDFVLRKVNNFLKEFRNKNKNTPKICCLGLAFKPDIDDFRESPAVNIAKRLLSQDDVIVKAVEPNFNGESLEGIPICSLNCLEDFDLAIVLVKHKEFTRLAFPKDLKIIDCVGLLH